MYCWRCGAKNDDQRIYCHSCGCALNPEADVPAGQIGDPAPHPEHPPGAGSPPRKRNVLLWIIPIAACIFIGVYFIIQLISGKERLTGAEYVIKHAEVVSLLFYEEGIDTIPYGQRKYHSRFSSEEARNICWELILEFPTPEEKIVFPITQKYYLPSGAVFGESTDEYYFEPGWNDVVLAWGYGWEYPGYWTTGTYTVELYIHDHLIAADQFEIY